MKEETFDALIGQLAADAALTHALASTLIWYYPHLRATVETQVEAAALIAKQDLSSAQRPYFEERMSSFRTLWRSAQAGWCLHWRRGTASTATG